jgi:hypothetical protein
MKLPRNLLVLFPPFKHLNQMSDVYKTRYVQYATGRDSKDLIPNLSICAYMYKLYPHSYLQRLADKFW